MSTSKLFFVVVVQLFVLKIEMQLTALNATITEFFIKMYVVICTHRYIYILWRFL